MLSHHCDGSRGKKEESAQSSDEANRGAEVVLKYGDFFFFFDLHLFVTRATMAIA
jgi:hypothetical protein